jgi:hypothetical protein
LHTAYRRDKDSALALGLHGDGVPGKAMPTALGREPHDSDLWIAFGTGQCNATYLFGRGDRGISAGSIFLSNQHAAGRSVGNSASADLPFWTHFIFVGRPDQELIMTQRTGLSPHGLEHGQTNTQRSLVKVSIFSFGLMVTSFELLQFVKFPELPSV